MSLLLFVFFFKGDDQGHVASTSPYLRGHWRSVHSVRILGIVLQNILNQLVPKSLSTPQPGSSMINQSWWIWYFDPNDMVWKESDVEWQTRAPMKLRGSVAGGGEGWIGEALVGCCWS